jgi:hypothetical protein
MRFEVRKMEQRLIDANKIKYRAVGAGGWNQPENVVSDYEIEKMPTVDAVPVDEIIFHHILIDKDGIPEVKLQLGERTLILRRENDPVDVVQVVRCANCKYFELYGLKDSCGHPRLEHHGQATFCKADDFCSYGEN